MSVNRVGAIALLVAAAIYLVVLELPSSRPSALFFPSSSFHHEHLRKQVQQALRDGKRRQAALEEADRARVLEHALQEEDPLGAEGFDLADFHQAIREVDKGSLRRRKSLGGIGTFPGGQSTGGASEFADEEERMQSKLSGKDEIMARDMRHQMWLALDAGCKFANTTEELIKCVSSSASLD
eukprot:599767-Hanusia_phi.AAC.2